MRLIYKFVPFQIELVTANSCVEGLSTPLPRSGHRMICIGSDLYAFGGYNHTIREEDYNDEEWRQSRPLFKELWKFNIFNKSWTRLRNNENMPKELASHSAVAFPPYMIVYGGTDTPFGQASSNSVHLCYLPNAEWTKLETLGNILPIPMYGQAVCREKEFLYVVGGTTGHQYSIDVHVLNLKTRVWTYLLPRLSNSDLIPDSRYRHEIAYCEECLYVFGGGTKYAAFSLEILPTFDLREQCWRFTKTHPDSTDGEYPQHRKCHILVKYKEYVYIQGGTNPTEHLNDMWRLDLKTMKWKQLKCATEKPIYFHSAAVTEEGTLYIFGGVWESESIRTNKMFKVHIDVPSLQTLAWQAVDFYAPNLSKLSPSKLHELGIPPLIAKSLKSMPDVG